MMDGDVPPSGGEPIHYSADIQAMTSQPELIDLLTGHPDIARLDTHLDEGEHGDRTDWILLIWLTDAARTRLDLRPKLVL